MPPRLRPRVAKTLQNLRNISEDDSDDESNESDSGNDTNDQDSVTSNESEVSSSSEDEENNLPAPRRRNTKSCQNSTQNAKVGSEERSVDGTIWKVIAPGGSRGK